MVGVPCFVASSPSYGGDGGDGGDGGLGTVQEEPEKRGVRYTSLLYYSVIMLVCYYVRRCCVNGYKKGVWSFSTNILLHDEQDVPS